MTAVDLPNVVPSPGSVGTVIAASLLSVVQSLPVPVVVHEGNAGAVVRLVNESFTRAFGYTLSDMPTVMAWADLAYPDIAYRDEVTSQWWGEVRARQSVGDVRPPGEYKIIDKAGQPRDVLIGFALHDDLVIVTFQDLTETRASEAALAGERHHNERTAFALTENMPAGSFAMVQHAGETSARFSFVSRQFLKLLALTRDEVVGQKMTGFPTVHPEDLGLWTQSSAEAFTHCKPFLCEVRTIASGKTGWIRAEALPRRGEDDSVIWEGNLVDITEIKQAEARLKMVIDASRAFTWTFDLSNGRMQFGEPWAVAHGYVESETDVDFSSWATDMHPEDVPAFMEKFIALRDGLVDRESAEYRRRHRDGHWIWLRTHAGISERDGEGRPVVLSGVSFEITAEVERRLRAQEQQALLREDLQRAQQRDMVAQVAGGVVHDVNNLIAVVSGTVESLETLAAGQSQMRDGLSRIKRSLDIAHDLTAGLGGLVRSVLPRSACDLGKLVHDAVQLLGQRRIAQHSIRLDLSSSCLPVWANPTEVAQVILNLAINACESGTAERPALVSLHALAADATPPARPPDVGIMPDVPVAIFAVSDTGSGITDTVRARMFRPHFTTKGDAGTGLGLPIVETILQNNRAALWVDSTPGVGTTMTVAWPVACSVRSNAVRQNWAPTRGDTEGLTVSAQLLQGLRILVVDDLPDVAEVLADMLEAYGATVIALSDPLEAAEALTEAPGVWSVLVTDLHMPGIEVRALARHAGSVFPPVPTVLVTARSDAVGGAHAEFADVLSKPVTGQLLSHAVFQAVSRWRD